MNEELNDTKIFEFDYEDYVKKLRKGIIPAVIILIIMMTFDHIFDSKTFSLQFNMVEFKTIILIVLITIFIYIFAKKTIPKKILLEINPNSFTLRNDKISETIPFSKINKIKVYKNKKEIPVFFVVKTGKINYHISSLKEMGRLLEWFEQNKISNLNWNLSFHKKSLLDIKWGALLGLFISLIVSIRILEIDSTLPLGILCVFIGIMTFIIQNKSINYLSNKISIFRWFYIVFGILFILTAIF